MPKLGLFSATNRTSKIRNDQNNEPNTTIASSSAGIAVAVAAAADAEVQPATTTTKDNNEDEDPSPPTAKQTLKDLIKITPGDEIEDDEGFIPLPSTRSNEGETEEGEEEVDSKSNPFQKAVQDLSSSVRGTFDTHVSPKVDELVSNSKYLLDTHVTPHLSNVQQHSSRMVQDVQTHSNKVWKDVQDNTSKATESIKSKSTKAIQNVQEHTTKFHEQHIKPHIDNVQTKTKEVQQQHIKPGIEKVISESARITQKTQSLILQYRPYYWNTATALSNQEYTDLLHTVPFYWIVIESTMRSYSQVIFGNNPVTGLFIWVAIWIASPLAGICSFITVVTINSTALYLDMDRTILIQGLYAYNGVLIGTSIVDYFTDFQEQEQIDETVSIQYIYNSGWTIKVGLSLLLAPITLFVQLWLRHYVLNIHDTTTTPSIDITATSHTTTTVPVLLLPYNIVMLIVLLCSNVWDSTMITKIDLNHENIMDDETTTFSTTASSSSTSSSSPRYFVYQAILNGIARIFLIDGVVSGIIMLIGITLCSRILALSLVGGTFFASLFSWILFDVSNIYVNAGYTGFNPALAIAGIFFYFVPTWKLMGLAFFWIIWTMFVTGAIDVILHALNIPVAMTFGFCFALLPLLTLHPETLFGDGHTLLKRIPDGDLSTPEEYLQKIKPKPIDEIDDENENDIVNDTDIEIGVDNTGNDRNENAIMSETPEADVTFDTAVEGEETMNEATPLLSGKSK